MNTKIKATLPKSSTNPSPEIEVFHPLEKSNRIGIIIYPGGGYEVLADHEGEGYANYFRQFGFTCFVVKYRLGSAGSRHPEMLEDALSSIYSIRKDHELYHIDEDKIGIMGSSAGGHLCSHALTQWHTYKVDVSLKPDFGILCYPVITFDERFVHSGSFNNLLGENTPDSEKAKFSTETLVDQNTPPCFIWHTLEDETVPAENSLLFCESLRKYNIPYQLHIYPHGGHGIGINEKYKWEEDCIRWMKESCEIQ